MSTWPQPSQLHHTFLAKRCPLSTSIVEYKYSNKKQQQESCLFAVMRHSIAWWNAKGKNIGEAHLRIIKNITSDDPQSFVITLADLRTYAFTTPYTDEIISHIRAALIISFPGMPTKEVQPHRTGMGLLSLTVTPEDRLSAAMSNFQPEIDIDHIYTGLAGSYTKSYISLCEYYGVKYREDVCYDIENALAKRDCRELRLEEWDEIDNSPQIPPMIDALHYNTWFTHLSISDIRLPNEASASLVALARRTSCLSHIELNNLNLGKDFYCQFAEAASQNPLSVLSEIVFKSCASIDDKAFLSLCTYATTARVPLTMLHVVGSSITKKSGVLSFSLLAKSEKVTKHIRSLDLSNSNIGNEGLAALAEFLSKCEVLAELKLHAVGIFDPVWSGLPTSLMHLEADLNKLGSERSNNISNALKSLINLRSLSLSDCKLGAGVLQTILRSIDQALNNACLSLNLTSCDISASDAKNFETSVPAMGGLTELTLNNIDFSAEEVLETVLRGALSYKLQALSFARCTMPSKSLGRLQALKPLYQHFTERTQTSLKILNFAYCNLRAETVVILDSLWNNKSVDNLNITGNQMGDKGALALSKLIQVNTTLRTIQWDENGISISGLQAVVIGLLRNLSLRHFFNPALDISHITKGTNVTIQAKVSSLSNQIHNHLYTQDPICMEEKVLPPIVSVDNTDLERSLTTLRKTVTNLVKSGLEADPCVTRSVQVIQDTEQALANLNGQVLDKVKSVVQLQPTFSTWSTDIMQSVQFLADQIRMLFLSSFRDVTLAEPVPILEQVGGRIQDVLRQSDMFEDIHNIRTEIAKEVYGLWSQELLCSSERNIANCIEELTILKGKHLDMHAIRPQTVVGQAREVRSKQTRSIVFSNCQSPTIIPATGSCGANIPIIPHISESLPLLTQATAIDAVLTLPPVEIPQTVSLTKGRARNMNRRPRSMNAPSSMAQQEDISIGEYTKLEAINVSHHASSVNTASDSKSSLDSIQTETQTIKLLADSVSTPDQLIEPNKDSLDPPVALPRTPLKSQHAHSEAVSSVSKSPRTTTALPPKIPNSPGRPYSAKSGSHNPASSPVPVRNIELKNEPKADSTAESQDCSIHGAESPVIDITTPLSFADLKSKMANLPIGKSRPSLFGSAPLMTVDPPSNTTQQPPPLLPRPPHQAGSQPLLTNNQELQLPTVPSRSTHIESQS